MNQLELLQNLNKYKKEFYTFSELQLILGLEKLSANKRIIDLVNQGFLIKLGRNVFVPTFWDFDIYKIISCLSADSYISFESALYLNGVVDYQLPKIVTLASFHKYHSREIGDYQVIYSRILPKFFFGFENRAGMLIADSEKAICDLLYMTSQNKGDFDYDQINWNNINMERFEKYLMDFPKFVSEWYRKNLVAALN